jgi:hypothetical protein
MSKFRSLLSLALTVGGLSVLAAGLTPSLAGAAFGPPAGPTSPPFWQCPAVGKSTSCAFLIDVTNGGDVIYQDSSQEFYDLGGDDEMVAVQNDSSTPLSSIHLGVAESGDNLFGFEGDGLCTPGVGAVPSGCPFGPGGSNEDPFDYYGPGMAFAPGFTADAGTVEFTPALQTGQYAYFGLDSPFETSKVVIPVGGNDYLTTALAGGTPENEPQISAPAPTEITDQATLVGPHKEGAVGTIAYKVYSDPACTHLVTGGDATPKIATVIAGVIPASTPVGALLATNANYYWQATFTSTGSTNPSDPTYNTNAVTACGAETMAFGTPPPRPQIGVSTTLSGGGQSGPSITVPPATSVTDTAAITGTNASTATGVVTYTVFADAGCTQQIKAFTVGTDTRAVAGGSAGASGALSFPLGTYYFRATYSGDESHAPAQSTCGGEVLTVAVPPPPNSQFNSVGNPQVNTKNGQIVVVGQFPAPGTATSTGVVTQGATLARLADTTAEAAGHRKCRRGFVKRRRKCVSNRPVTYGTTTLTIPAPGTYSIVISPTSRVLTALRAGKKLNVVVSTTFQNRAGGAPVTHVQDVRVKLKTNHGRGHRRRR